MDRSLLKVIELYDNEKPTTKNRPQRENAAASVIEFLFWPLFCCWTFFFSSSVVPRDVVAVADVYRASIFRARERTCADNASLSRKEPMNFNNGPPLLQYGDKQRQPEHFLFPFFKKELIQIRRLYFVASDRRERVQLFAMVSFLDAHVLRSF